MDSSRFRLLHYEQTMSESKSNVGGGMGGTRLCRLSVESAQFTSTLDDEVTAILEFQTQIR